MKEKEKESKHNDREGLPDKKQKDTILGDVNSGTNKKHGAQPMSGSLGKDGEWEADLEAGAGNTDD